MSLCMWIWFVETWNEKLEGFTKGQNWFGTTTQQQGKMLYIKKLWFGKSHNWVPEYHRMNWKGTLMWPVTYHRCFLVLRVTDLFWFFFLQENESGPDEVFSSFCCCSFVPSCQDTKAKKTTTSEMTLLPMNTNVPIVSSKMCMCLQFLCQFMPSAPQKPNHQTLAHQRFSNIEHFAVSESNTRAWKALPILSLCDLIGCVLGASAVDKSGNFHAQARIQDFGQGGPSRGWTTRGAWAQNLLKIGVFPLKLPEKCVISKKFWGRAPWIRYWCRPHCAWEGLETGPP